MSEYKREVAAAVAISVVGALFLTAAAICLFPSQSSLSPVGVYPVLRIVPNSLVCTSYASCQLTVENTGDEAGWISGARPSSGSVTFSTSPAGVPAPGNTTFNIAISGASAGEAVNGYLTQTNGGNLTFSITLPNVAPVASTTTTSTATPINDTS